MQKYSLLFFICFCIPCFSELSEYQKAYQISLDLETKYEYGKSFEKLQEIYEKYKEDYELNLRLGYLCYLNYKYEDAIKYWQKSLQIKSASIEAKNWILLALICLQKWQEAQDYAKGIIKQDPTNYYANIRLAYIYYWQGRWENALERYHMLHALYPSDLDVKLGLASTYLYSGKKDKASHFYLEILKVSPFHTTAYYGYCKTIK